MAAIKEPRIQKALSRKAAHPSEYLKTTQCISEPDFILSGNTAHSMYLSKICRASGFGPRSRFSFLLIKACASACRSDRTGSPKLHNTIKGAESGTGFPGTCLRFLFHVQQCLLQQKYVCIRAEGHNAVADKHLVNIVLLDIIGNGLLHGLRFVIAEIHNMNL